MILRGSMLSFKISNQVAASICGRYKIPISAFMAHSDCEMLLADIVSHVLTLFMEFMYHLSQCSRSAAVRHCFTCPLSPCVCVWNSCTISCQCLRVRPATIMMLLVHSFHFCLLYISLTLPVQTSAHVSPLPFFSNCHCFPTISCFIFLFFCVQPCWRLRQSWLKNLLMTLSVSASGAP
ncbi:uncharacterized protein LOC114389376 isoform X3 [Glycine soja]|uniref:uncharacterized protein LOC114389376 isoform X3 n=1 Tax=Glycine soja TaxID=3848 RepID=UPI000719411E|nr:uncharacterized protein LOC114389376 isoform X3 [Glycine soja]